MTDVQVNEISIFKDLKAQDIDRLHHFFAVDKQNQIFKLVDNAT